MVFLELKVDFQDSSRRHADDVTVTLLLPETAQLISSEDDYYGVPTNYSHASAGNRSAWFKVPIVWHQQANDSSYPQI